MIADRKLGDNKRYSVGVSGITTDSDYLVFRGSAGLSSSRERKEFTIRLASSDPRLLVGDHSLVLKGFKKQVAERLLNRVTYEEGNGDFLRLGTDIQISLK